MNYRNYHGYCNLMMEIISQILFRIDINLIKKEMILRVVNCVMFNRKIECVHAQIIIIQVIWRWSVNVVTFVILFSKVLFLIFQSLLKYRLDVRLISASCDLNIFSRCKITSRALTWHRASQRRQAITRRKKEFFVARAGNRAENLEYVKFIRERGAFRSVSTLRSVSKEVRRSRMNFEWRCASRDVWKQGKRKSWHFDAESTFN